MYCRYPILWFTDITGHHAIIKCQTGASNRSGRSLLAAWHLTAYTCGMAICLIVPNYPLTRLRSAWLDSLSGQVNVILESFWWLYGVIMKQINYQDINIEWVVVIFLISKMPISPGGDYGLSPRHGLLRRDTQGLIFDRPLPSSNRIAITYLHYS